MKVGYICFAWSPWQWQKLRLKCTGHSLNFYWVMPDWTLVSEHRALVPQCSISYGFRNNEVSLIHMSILIRVKIHFWIDLKILITDNLDYMPPQSQMIWNMTFLRETEFVTGNSFVTHVSDRLVDIGSWLWVDPTPNPSISGFSNFCLIHFFQNSFTNEVRLALKQKNNNTWLADELNIFLGDGWLTFTPHVQP